MPLQGAARGCRCRMSLQGAYFGAWLRVPLQGAATGCGCQSDVCALELSAVCALELGCECRSMLLCRSQSAVCALSLVAGAAAGCRCKQGAVCAFECCPHMSFALASLRALFFSNWLLAGGTDYLKSSGQKPVKHMPLQSCI